MPNIMQKESMRKFAMNGKGAAIGGHHHAKREEDARLRRLADVRSVINPHGRQSLPPPPLPRLREEPPIPQGLSGSQSTPSLHEFATRTHLARLDIAYDKLDTYVEQSIMQLQSGVHEQIEKLKAWVESKIGGSEEKLAAALATVQSTRSVLDNAVSSLSQGGKNDELKARIASCEERLLGHATNSAEMRERIAALDEALVERVKAIELRLGKEILEEAAPKAVAERLKALELYLQAEVLDETAPKALDKRLKSLEIHLGHEALEEAAPKALSERLNLLELYLGIDVYGGETTPKALDDRLRDLEERLKAEPPKAADSSFPSELESRLQALEEQLQSNLELAEKVNQVSGAVHQCKTALEYAVSDLSEKVSDHSLNKDMQGRISDARYESLENGLGELRNQMEAGRLERTALHIDMEKLCAEKIAVLEEKALSVEKSDLRVLRCRQESFSTSLDTVAQRLQIVLSGKDASENVLSRLEKEVDAEGNRLSVLEEKVVTEETRLSALEGKAASEETSQEVSMSTGLSEDLRLKCLEELLGSMVSSIASLEQRLAGGGVSARELFDLRVRVEAGFKAMLVRMESARYLGEQEDRVGDVVFQRFVSGLDERIKLIETHVNKNNHWIEKLMAKSGLKVKTLQVKMRCDSCDAPYDPDHEVCTNCGEQWKANLHDQLKQKHEGHRLRKFARGFMSQKENDRKMNLVAVAFDIWARGEHATSFKSYKKAHPRDHRVTIPAPVDATKNTDSITSTPTPKLAVVDSSVRDEPLADSGGKLSPVGDPDNDHSAQRSESRTVVQRSQSVTVHMSPVKEPTKRRFLTNPFASNSRSVGALPPLQG